MTVSPPVVHFREQLPPHGDVLVTDVADVKYAFTLTRPAKASFRLPRTDPNLASYYWSMDVGACVSIERSDHQLPWVGFVTQVQESKEDPFIQYQCEDHAGALFARAATMRGAKMTGAWGDIITRLYLEADQRSTPPLMAELDVTGGPYGEFTPQAGSVLALVDTAARGADWEWRLVYQVGPTVQTSLRFRERAGRDHTGEILWEDGLHFTNVSYTRNAAGQVGAVIAVGGSGDFIERDAVLLSRAGSGGAGVSLVRALASPQPISNLAGTSVYIDPQITGQGSLWAAAARAHERPDEIAEQLSFSLYENAIDMTRLDVGSYYSVRLSDLNFGHAREMTIRLLGIQLGSDGVIDCESQVVV